MDTQRALTQKDVEIGQTWYVQQTDTDAKVIRFHGPFLEWDAQTKAEHFRSVGHDSQIMDAPSRVKKVLTGAKC